MRRMRHSRLPQCFYFLRTIFPEPINVDVEMFSIFVVDTETRFMHETVGTRHGTLEKKQRKEEGGMSEKGLATLLSPHPAPVSSPLTYTSPQSTPPSHNSDTRPLP